MSSDNSRRRRLSEDERVLWGRITRSVMPLRRRSLLADPDEPVSTPTKAKAVPPARAHAAARSPTTPSKPAPKPVPSLEPLGRRQKQRLARGTLDIEARIDLHGKTQSQAHAALLRFLQAAQRDGAKFVLVITGKGARAQDERGERGVLKRQVPLWLKLPEFRAYVVGFEDAHIGHGGEGALYVRLRRARAAH
jgi:DNA-nicking Smr family endonuclease